MGVRYSALNMGQQGDRKMPYRRINTKSQSEQEQESEKHKFWYTGDMITLIAGYEPHLEEFHVHQKHASYYSPVLRAAFEGSFMEAATKIYRLEDVPREACQLFVEWLYTQTFEFLRNDRSRCSIELSDPYPTFSHPLAGLQKIRPVSPIVSRSRASPPQPSWRWGVLPYREGRFSSADSHGYAKKTRRPLARFFSSKSSSADSAHFNLTRDESFDTWSYQVPHRGVRFMSPQPSRRIPFKINRRVEKGLKDYRSHGSVRGGATRFDSDLNYADYNQPEWIHDFGGYDQAASINQYAAESGFYIQYNRNSENREFIPGKTFMFRDLEGSKAGNRLQGKEKERDISISSDDLGARYVENEIKKQSLEEEACISEPAIEETLVHLWLLGQELLIPALQNAAIDALHHQWELRRVVPTQTLHYVWANTLLGSRLRNWFINICQHTFPGSWVLEHGDDFPKEMLLEVLAITNMENTAQSVFRAWPDNSSEIYHVDANNM